MTTPPTLDPAIADAAPLPSQQITAPSMLICAPSLSAAATQAVIAAITAAFPGESVLLATPGQTAGDPGSHVRIVPPASAISQQGWALTAGDYVNAGALAGDHNVATVLLLGPEAESISPQRLRSLIDPVHNSRIDLVLPRLSTAPGEGLVTSALLYPLTRALFGADIHFPLPWEAAMSQRMALRLATVAQRLAGSGQSDALVWPVPEAAIAGFSVRDVAASDLSLPTPPDEDFNTLFTSVASSLFSDIEAKATFWQRARNFAPASGASPSAPGANAEPSAEILSLVDGFHLAYANLQELWSLVLPPQTLLALKRLASVPPADFAIAPSLWARIVYDFTLAFHLRTLNRGHLLGAFTPLYLAWVASHLRAAEADPTQSPYLAARTAAAFEVEKPYLVARWRWPDRFNP